MKVAEWALPQVNVVLVVLQEKVLAIITDSILLCLFGLILFICSLSEPMLHQSLLELRQCVKDEREITDLHAHYLISISETQLCNPTVDSKVFACSHRTLYQIENICSRVEAAVRITLMPI